MDDKVKRAKNNLFCNAFCLLTVTLACFMNFNHVCSNDNSFSKGAPSSESHSGKKDKLDVSRIYGKIKIVTAFADYKVKVVDHFPDLRVKVVDHFPDGPGKWQLVDHFPDYTIQLVDHFPDFTIKWVDHFPGK
ncbi:MAG: hypothetical protein WBM02_09160 [bacterium]